MAELQGKAGPNPQSMTFSVGVAAARLRAFTTLYKIVLLIEAALAAGLLIVPRLMARIFADTKAIEHGYPLWGTALLAIIVLQLPGMLSPIHARLTVIAGVIGRGLLVIAYLLSALWLPAVVTGAAAIAVAVAFSRLVYAELDNRP